MSLWLVTAVGSCELPARLALRRRRAGELPIGRDGVGGEEAHAAMSQWSQSAS